MGKSMPGWDIARGFAETSAGGSFVFRADEGHELVYADEGVIRFFGCDSFDDLSSLTGKSFNGIVNEDQLEAVLSDIDLQLRDSVSPSGYVFFNITAKNGDIKRVVNHYALVTDESGQKLFYAFIFPHRQDNVGSDLDSLTDLYSRRKFLKFAQKKNEDLLSGSPVEYAIIYLNLVNFKLLNIEHGVREGDSCLKIIADLLKESYDDALISRVSGDHFAILSRYEGLTEKTMKVRDTFFDSYGMRYGVIIKFGIYRFTPSWEFDVEAALSQAKIACDFIKYKSGDDIVEYSENLANAIMASDYVVNRIDDAIENGWIKVFYQPVIRSITGSLCSFESLARWIDPEIGFLSPDKFITALENERCIHKLDCYIVEQVCRVIHERMEKKLPMVPVSVNFSRLDFVLCDMLRVVEDLVEKYDIPRDFLHIEITESMIASDAELMRKVMESFTEAGYEIWMDDFGSGYSSLTLLKDYKFDTLKLDMKFLNPFTDKSRSIVKATVSMAKDIGMKTLCEGVETKEHLDFLKEIGCGMIQGYYYAPPKPLNEIFEVLKEKNITIETRKLRHFYEVAGFHTRYTDTPLEILEDDGENFKTLFMNRKYREEIFDTDGSGILNVPEDLEELDRIIYRSGSPLLSKYRDFANLIEKTGKRENFYHTANDNYFCFTAQVIASYSGRYLIEGTIVNISHDRWVRESLDLDRRLRELNLLFEDVILINVGENTAFPLLGGFRYLDEQPGKMPRLNKLIELFAKEKVLPEEKDDFITFMDTKNLFDRVSSAGKGYIESAIQVRQADGNYKWTEFYLLLIPGTRGNEYLLCLKSFTEKSTNLLEKESRSALLSDKSHEFSNIFANIVMDSSIKFFWKDKDRRFTGLSRASREYFGFESDKPLVGKTDEDMNWLVDEETSKNFELDVLNKGKYVRDIYGQCVVRGVVHNIIYSKIPLYEEGEIIGLIGYFTDRDDEIERVNKKLLPSKLDGITGLMNSHAFIDSMIDYAKRYHSGNRDYGLILFNNSSHKRIIETYDKEFSNSVLKEIGEHIVKAAANSCPVARMKESIFSVLVQTDSERELEALAMKIKTELKEILSVGGNPVTLRIKVTYKLRSTHPSSDESLYEELLKNITDR